MAGRKNKTTKKKKGGGGKEKERTQGTPGEKHGRGGGFRVYLKNPKVAKHSTAGTEGSLAQNGNINSRKGFEGGDLRRGKNPTEGGGNRCVPEGVPGCLIKCLSVIEKKPKKSPEGARRKVRKWCRA